MAALTGPRNAPRLDDEAVPDRLSYPIAANTFVHQGGMVALNSSGQAVPAGSGAAVTQAMGVALDEVDNTNASSQGWSGLAGAVNVEIQRGAFAMDNGAGGDQVSNSSLAGAPLYVIDDHTVGLTDSNGTRKFAGYLLGVNVAGSNGGPNYPDGSADGRVYLQVGADFIHPALNTYPYGQITIPLTYSAFSNALIATITPKFAGRIKAISISTTQAATGAGATCTLTTAINAVNLTGGVVTPTLANSTLGAEVAGTAITGNNVFSGTQAITVTGSATTAFTAGAGCLNLYLG